ncbi:MAG: hypothetical protein EHM87_19580 [Burkholderiales bacterium]|nr:MAG: hypothetical protein EHM87_19580 [Burkholderiales bacterium]
MTKSQDANQPGSKIKEKTPTQEPAVAINSFQPPKNPVGRPPKFKTPEEIEVKIIEYFEIGAYCPIGKTSVGEKVTKYIPTLTGLILWLGFSAKEDFYIYCKKPDFSAPLKRARLLIEQTYEQQLRGQYSSGAIFALKNFGWVDTPLIDNSRHYHISYGYRSKPIDSALRTEGRPGQLTESDPAIRS